ncbi:MAG TPA: metallophosphoesterase, partial [Bacillota bacterium]|nr:metallophosphoesterase [Bacillota bacterium]
MEPSLTGFVDQFCAAQAHRTRQAEDATRDAMIQPNVYWTLLAPFVTVVGLYTNVPEGGEVAADQAAWLRGELAAAPVGATLIVTLHHPIYSADAHHGGSARMGAVLDQAVAAAGRWPDLVVMGHVHNYQRFTRRVAGREVPNIVNGAGGYWHLHAVAKGADGGRLPVPWAVPGMDVTLEQNCDDWHGFLRLDVTAGTIRGRYRSVPRPQESWRAG